MKVLFDYQTFSIQQYGGISRYFYELIKRFNNGEATCNVGAILSNNAYLNKDTYPGLYPFFPKKQFKGREFLIKKINQVKATQKLNGGDFDVFHPTYYNDYFLNNIGNKPFVVTFYDMIHEKFAEYFSGLSQDSPIYQQKRTLAEKSNRIIAISETTKKDIIELFGINESKIDVVYLANSLNVNDKQKSRIVNEDYILYVGNRSVYKNFQGFVTVAAELLTSNNLKLVCGGGGKFSTEEIDFINKMGLQNNVILIDKIDDNILFNLYKNAIYFVFPSLYEGFGIPVLEAFASGCPVLMSDGGSLPEIGGDAAVCFQLEDQQSLFNAASSLINSEELREKMVIKGAEREKGFSWDKTFQDTLNVYQKVI